MRNYISTHYQGEKKGEKYHHLWTQCEMIDLEVDTAYRSGGVARADWLLENNDSLEHMLARVGAEVAYCKYKGRNMFNELLTSKPPGDADILPGWSLAASRDASKQLHQQEARNRDGFRGNRGGYKKDSSEEDGQKNNAHARRRKGKNKATAAEKPK